MIVFLLLLLLVIAVVAAYLVILLTTSAIVFSRVAFALLGALLASQGNLVLVGTSGFLNYVAWAIIFLGAIHLLSLLPRVDMALRFFCTILMSLVTVEIVVLMCGSLIASISGEQFQMNVLYEILVKLVCIGAALWSLISLKKKAAYNSPSGKFLRYLERLLSALLYGIAVAFLFVPIHGHWKLPGIALLLVFVFSTAAAFAADIYLTGKDIFGTEEPKEVSMPK